MVSSRWSIPGAALVLLLALVGGHAASGATAPARSIVFAAHPNGAGASQLFRIQTTGEGVAQITKGALPATSPAFSPDGKRVVFVRLGAGIYVVNVDGTGLRKLSSNGRDSFPVWSPDGKSIAFIRPYQAQWRLYVMSASGSGKRRLRQAPPAGRPSWALDSRSIFIPAGGDLVRVDLRTGKVLKYYGVTLDIQTAQSATVSPNLRQIAFVMPRVSTGPEDCGEGPCPQYGLHVANVAPPHRSRRIVNDTGPAGWSPDAKTIVFVSRGALTLWDVAASKRTAIATGAHVATGDTPPAWQPR